MAKGDYSVSCSVSKMMEGHRGWNCKVKEPEEVRDSRGSTSDHLSSHGMNEL